MVAMENYYLDKYKPKIISETACMEKKLPAILIVPIPYTIVKSWP